MKRSSRSRRSANSPRRTVGEYSRVDQTSVGLVVPKHRMPEVGTSQNYGPLPVAHYHNIPTGALALSVLPWPVPSTSGLEDKQEIQESIEDKFSRLADKWEQETQFLSSVGDIVTHKAHLRIMAMGREVIPLILERMRHKPGMWFYALCFLTRDDPISDDVRGDFDAMTAAWLEWGEKNGYSRSKGS